MELLYISINALIFIGLVLIQIFYHKKEMVLIKKCHKTELDALKVEIIKLKNNYYQ